MQTFVEYNADLLITFTYNKTRVINMTNLLLLILATSAVL